MGLLAKGLEERGFTTVCLTNLEDVIGTVAPPRVLALKWPFGHPFGEAGGIAQQSKVLERALRLAYAQGEPTLWDRPGWRWRRERYEPPDYSWAK